MGTWDFLLSSKDSGEWFSTYSYTGEDHALLMPIRRPFCLWLVSFIPMWWTPHSLTIVGSAAMLPYMKHPARTRLPVIRRAQLLRLRLTPFAYCCMLFAII